MNLNFDIENEDLRVLLEPYGKVQEIELPMKYKKKTGYAFVRFENIESAISAYAALDQKYF
jgi:RNA recognition motif-containing protein